MRRRLKVVASAEEARRVQRAPPSAEEIDAAVTFMGETRMEGVAYSVARLVPPFCVAGLSGPLGLCYFVKRGTVWLEREGETNGVVELREGTVVGGSGLVAHWFKSDPRATTRRARTIEHTPLGGPDEDRGGAVELVIGHVPVESLALVSVMGDIMVIPPDVDSPVCRRIWNAIAQIEDELTDARPMGGATPAVRRQSEIILLNMARHTVATGARDAEEALNMRLDLRIVRATAAAAHGPLSTWTVAKLARIAGMSRTTFAERFHRLTGSSPLQTITRMRLRLAAAELARGRRTVAQVADEAGYGSPAAFIRAFERYFHSTPKQWRATHRSEAPVSRTA
jgi:AraC-like DNA-binding protein